MTISSRCPNLLLKVTLAAVSVASATSALAAGFSLNEQSATASGTALAGAAASSSDISFSYWNPALFVNAKKTTFYASGAYITTDQDVTVNSATDALGNDISSSGGASDPIDDFLVPSLYFAKPLSDKTVFGMSLNAPFGLAGDYGDDWAGRYHATNTALQDIALSFSLAHKMNDWISVGASVQVHQADVELDAAVYDPYSTGSYGEIDADATGYGYSLGVALEPIKGTRLGLGYRSEVDFDFKGTVSYTGVSSIIESVYGIENANVSDSLTFPSVLTLSAEQDLTDKLILGFTALRTGWSSLEDGLDIDYDSSQADSILTFGFEDTWLYAVGLTYIYSDKLTLRTGIARDNSPVTDEYRSARTPDGDRTWISLGATYDFTESTSATVAYTHVSVDDVTVDRDGTSEDALRGTLNADYETSANVLSLAVNMTF